MHRSGTSAIAGVLTALGFHPGSQLIPSVAGVNTKGFFEDERVGAINDALLASAGRDWQWPTPLPNGWQNSAEIAAIRPQIHELLQEQQQNPLWLLKDPRLCLTLAVWLQELEQLNITPQILLTFRPVTEVSKSLLQRDKLPHALGEQLWVNHLLESELVTRELPRRLLPYLDLLANTADVIDQLVDWLQLSPTADQRSAAIEFISAAEHHHHADPQSQPTSPLARDLEALLAAATIESADDPLSDAELRQSLDQLNQRAASGRADFQHLVDAQASAFRELDSSFEQALDQLETHKASAKAHEASALASADAARQQYDALTTAVTQINTNQQALESSQTELDALRAALQQEQTDHQQFRDRAQRVLGDQVLPPADATAREQDSNDYKGLINLQVENNAHTRVIRYLREHLQTSKSLILEIGCSEGYFGAALKDDGHTVWGIETNAIAAAHAEQALDLVFRDSIEAFLLTEQHLDTRFDAIVFGDVLEHLLDPVRVLRAVSERLADNGMIVASVPNVAHERVRMMLLEGRWEYSATGIMDNTHLHFFTRDTLVDLFTNAGLAVKRVSPIVLPGEQVQIEVDPRTQMVFEEIVTDREREVFQFVVLAQTAGIDEQSVRDANEGFQLRKQQRLLCLPPLADSSLYSIRIGDPLERYGQLYGGEVRLAPFGAPTEEDVAWADTVVLQREVTDDQLALVRHLQALDKRVIFDIDDYLLDVPSYLAAHEHCAQMRPNLTTMLSLVDAVSASTGPLREKLLAHNPNVFLTPNYAWTSHPPIEHNDPVNDEPIRVIVASSDSVRVDFLVETLQQLVAGYPVELVGIGPPGEFLRDVGIPIDTAPVMGHEQFKAYLASRPNTIALIPLDDNEFNNCKSAIKFFDYALAGVPCVCSGIEPYSSAVEQNVSGLLCPDITEHWVHAISELINHTELRRTLARNAHAQVLRHHNLNLTAAAWHDLFTGTRFPDADPLYVGEYEGTSRTGSQLARGTLRHAMRPQSWKAALRTIKSGGLRALRDKWKSVF